MLVLHKISLKMKIMYKQKEIKLSYESFHVSSGKPCNPPSQISLKLGVFVPTIKI